MRFTELPDPTAVSCAAGQGLGLRARCPAPEVPHLQLPGCQEGGVLNPASVSWAILELKHSSGGLTGSSQLVDGFYKIWGAIHLGPV